MASTTSGRHYSAGKPPLACLPPWLEHTMPSAPKSAACRASSAEQIPLINNGKSVIARIAEISPQLSVGLPKIPAQVSSAACSVPLVER
ncbi:hypothetical protein RSal33209_2835 [Renibacterium salmoninarum ATCC 33209]|uniref:Uncharacterized protein n=1 Tax=Renibacterium salmoninarum (strain ATCC 33209 / DSM 20767 / JCM 11484 / NBRC 15589 / NCIMB 2235) TaxID=288705 RepID=A9WTN8_RENSM|nr:hypothetical protein RSal33209_2835 [Renibacterium salmoninarum ATCC 33209]